MSILFNSARGAGKTYRMNLLIEEKLKDGKTVMKLYPDGKAETMKRTKHLTSIKTTRWK